MRAPPLYVFDGHCVLCSKGLADLLKPEAIHDKRCIAILSQEGRDRAAAHNIDPRAPESFLYVTGGQTYQKSDAVLALLKDAGGPAKIFRAGRIIPKVMRDFIYGIVAKNRYRLFGRTDMCYVPSPETRHRFILE